ncbi:hypothetical protein J2S54_006794 [Streptomyces sp. DSM 42143]|nr:hypothetical protein [Streptomyces sp. DSM 42143]
MNSVAAQFGVSAARRMRRSWRKRLGWVDIGITAEADWEDAPTGGRPTPASGVLFAAAWACRA